jgi:hypothetical protein
MRASVMSRIAHCPHGSTNDPRPKGGLASRSLLAVDLVERSRDLDALRATKVGMPVDRKSNMKFQSRTHVNTRTRTHAHAHTHTHIRTQHPRHTCTTHNPQPLHATQAHTTVFSHNGFLTPVVTTKWAKKAGDHFFHFDS